MSRDHEPGMAGSALASPCECGGIQSSPVLLDVRCIETRAIYSILSCERCGLWRTDPVPEDLSAAYRGEAAGWMRQRETGLFARMQRVQLAREARRVARLDAQDGVLDVGSGSGSFARVLRQQGHVVRTADAAGLPAVDPDLSHHVFDFERGEVEALPPGRYGAVLRHVLEHLRHPQTALRRLQAQGVEAFYLVVPNVGCAERRWFGRDWFLWDPPRHLWHFDGASLRRLVEGAGLEIVAEGKDTIPNAGPSLHRALRRRGQDRLAAWCAPRGSMNALLMPVNAMFRGNVQWVLARRLRTACGRVAPS